MANQAVWALGKCLCRWPARARGMESRGAVELGVGTGPAVAVVPISPDEGRRKERGHDIPEEIFRAGVVMGFVAAGAAAHAASRRPSTHRRWRPKENIQFAGAGAWVHVPPGSGAGGRYRTMTTVEIAARVLKAAGAERVCGGAGQWRGSRAEKRV